MVERERVDDSSIGLMVILRNERLIVYKNSYGEVIKIPVSVISNRYFPP